MERFELIFESIKFAQNMISFNSQALNSIHKIYFNWNNLFGTEKDLDDPEYAFLFYCVDFFDETLVNISEEKLPPLSKQEKMNLFCKNGKEGVVQTGKRILVRLENLLHQEKSTGAGTNNSII